MELPLIMHINCCEHGHTLEDACRMCSKLGFDGIEFRRKRSRIVEDAGSYLDSISQAVEKYGVKYVIFGSPGLLKAEGTNAEKEQEMEELIRFYETASTRFKLSICNTFAGAPDNPDKSVPRRDYTKYGSFIANEEHWDWAIKSFRVLGKLAQKLGFKFAFETHMRFLNDTIESTVRLVREIDNPAVGINLDYGNLVYFENTPSIMDTANLAGDRLYYLHLKNSIGLPDGSRLATGLSEGDIDNREFIKVLEEAGYQGPLCIEVTCKGDREWHVQNDLYYLRRLMAKN